MGKKIAIIGAGASGLAAIKCCLDEGLEPVCFDKADDIGGLWYYREEREDQGCVYESTVINTSKEVMCFSDFPIPDDFPNFMHNRLVLKYYRLFCDRFDLRKYIHFHTKVDSAVFADDFKETGQWKVTTTHQETCKSMTEIYDAVLVCTGHHCTPYTPDFEGLKEFKGQVLHTHDYLKPDGFAKKRIMVIGVGNSGCDAAVELSRCASQVYLSTRRGTWIIHRLAEGGMPVDILAIRRMVDLLPDFIKNIGMKNSLQRRVNHKFLGIQPNHSPLSQHPTVNDFLPNCIMNGSIIVKPDVKRFTSTGVVFQDGTTEDLDVVILGTGYIFRFPFLEDSVIKVEQNKLPLYKYVFPVNLQHPTIAFLGYIQPLGAINPISELQARWATRVFKGLTKLPSSDQMKADMMSKEEAMAKRYISSQRHTIQVDFIKYMDDVALEFGVKPDFWKMLLSDPVLALKCVCGPYTPYQYRLVGPGQWSGARDAIIGIWNRINKPLQTRKSQDTSDSFLSSWMLWMVLVSVALYFYLF
ncbi:flavin-containing monooxygenase 5-like [Lytechinus variegatus]|uniref:flavin-containing monooxygenase 5-like n=1 Tax=Lytechinus variegatus TaxID=7654 RepID=UPI001BB2B416|nr:flavin-containing monooxygenase 5-like [Lytechinus variegatus]XP_041482054.1 flavin-containing monooxygenase 5-like [Lytechinus variegatus]XP_041482055.1 flavin-containing monooxygenase 5-like [Lytechinus variegatus]XP_041482057.1 flavin-containing monooxygenase 5-like [Lytechinus variegatus]XP_041482058.1 flavin-containing monooxygenase 5-like [Lytechinus variegatus]XP_041482059.1 flavin-containing monooxygenase 5-like [Lytechinus variegatus]